jgi:hypothetical protein
MGGQGKVVEADETYFGNTPERKGRPKKHGFGGKRAIIGLVERGGEVRTFHVPAAFVVDIVEKNIARESRLHTDERKLYHWVGKQFAAHETVKHSDYEYVRGDVATNTRSKATSQFSREECAGCISTVRKSICIVISRI